MNDKGYSKHNSIASLQDYVHIIKLLKCSNKAQFGNVLKKKLTCTSMPLPAKLFE